MTQLKNIYISNGLNEFKLTNHNDLIKVYGIDVVQIHGYSNLSAEHKNIFDFFIINFFNACGLETRARLMPVSINFVLDEEYLGKENESDACYIPLGGKLTALHDGGKTKVIRCWKDKVYCHLPCICTERQRYLRFEYKNGKSKTWQHVISAAKWY
ncbi:hypothetical protein LY28_03722 [Ruminiclostridium sufflavum DSM 19573]|uniref:Uncharacterized protein n=1 Tax=Ruminiclostridium sufflavum DSM 19573 TaxID=1121337 RepID=A0A318XRT3_9FIRM|nr:hypothetical protein [Ruminiclostridium sufflavum]PYG84270.1 hypothetical protein LY28_03722 [Ruminiclostridium sufflavum DSM 19573]